MKGGEDLKCKYNPGYPGVRPRKGTFEVRLSNGTTIVSLVGMKRRFVALRELDLEATAKKVVKAATKAKK